MLQKVGELFLYLSQDSLATVHPNCFIFFDIQIDFTDTETETLRVTNNSFPNNSLPLSLYKTNETQCYLNETIGPEPDKNVTSTGCHPCSHKVSEQFSYAAKVSGAVGLFFSFTEVVQTTID